VQAEWPAIQKAQLMRNPLIHANMLAFRGTLALNVARHGGPDAPALRELAGKDARAIVGLHVPSLVGFSHLIRARLAYDDANVEQTATLVRAGMIAFEQERLPLCAASMRRRLGHLLGGDEGAALVAQADNVLREMGAADPEATTRLFTFGD
jgi:hypothetical protein